MISLAYLLFAAAPLISGELKSDDDVIAALREHYTKHEYEIPMRDGVKLHTDVWTPKAEISRAAISWPILIMRTPYAIGPYGVDQSPDPKNHRRLTSFAPSPRLIQLGYIFVHQDVRGRLLSEGTFVDVRPMADINEKRRGKSAAIDESTDAYDTIDFLVKQIPHNNGRVGIWGISYPGFYAAQAAVDAHPALKAVMPMAPVTDWYLGDDAHHNGAFFLADMFSFLANFGRARAQPTTKIAWDFEPDITDIYEFFRRLGPLKNANEKYFHNRISFWDELLAHPNRDAWWEARDPRRHYKNVKPAVMVVGGWYDAEDLWGALHTYQAMESQTQLRNRVSLVMGPWQHGGWHRTDGDRLGDISFGQKTSLAFQNEIEAPFFESHLKGNGSFKPAEAHIFVTGINEWRQFSSWPPNAHNVSLYFSADEALLKQPPSDDGADAFVSDPKKPVPYFEAPTGEVDRSYLTGDQRFAARRPDVLIYETTTLAEDVTVAGPVTANIWFATTGGDADVVVKLVDVWPESAPEKSNGDRGALMRGYQQLVRGDVFRGRFRHNFSTPIAFRSNQTDLVRFSLPDIAHTFRAGHRIMVQIQSSWFPLVDMNPQTFVDIATADVGDFQTQTHTVVRSPAHPTHVVLPIQSGRLP